MPFFRNTKKIYHNKNVTLQVRKSPDEKKYSPKRVWLSASLTVEAALVLPLFVFAAATLMLPMKMMDNQRKIQAALENVCENASKYAYIQYLRQNGEENSLNTDSDSKENIWQAVDTAAVWLYASANIRKYADEGLVSGVSFARSEILKDGEHIYLVMDYTMIFPFSVFRMKGLPMTAVSRRRAWIGRDGLPGEGGEGGQEDDTIVYVGKKSTRYHWSRTCHYLDNDLHSCAGKDIAAMRNDEGRKYAPCAMCGKSAGENSTVYVLPSGTSYHSNPYCSSIIAYVKAVPLSEVSYLGACSYCSRNRGGE